MSPQLSLSSVQAIASPRLDDPNVSVVQFPLNNHECFRAEILTRDGKPIVSVSRWKKTSTGVRRTGQAFEFGAHRNRAITDLLIEVQRVLDALHSEGGAS